ncbi:MAG: nucleotidyltransferase [Fervidobacterium sp.]|uniref:nucleotidyltransferase n=1 Tax=Fervidobacterium sp. TaxID=1871331 RepID=UPI00404ADD26
MKVLGLVVEYNPFHYGHLHHLNESIRLVNPDYVVAVMSGNFCQRGEPAIVNKFARAKIALMHGIDVVFELPTIYAVQDAGGFALGSVGILHKTGVVTDIVFGSESGDIEFLKKVAHLLTYQTPEFAVAFKKHLKLGYSYPNARKYALMDVLNNDVGKLSKSNDILGIEYIKSLIRYNSSITPHVINRIGADYNDETFRGKFSSASAIRKAIKGGLFETSKEAIPKFTYEVIHEEFEAGRGPVFWENLEFVIPLFRKLKREDFERIYSFNEGLDLRFYESARETGDLQQFVELVKAKRFTYSRIRRAILHVLFDMDKERVEKSNELGPQYLRVLGFSEKGRELLKVIKKNSSIPIISTASLYKQVLEGVEKDIAEEKKAWDVDSELYLWQFEKDLLASDIYTFLYPNKSTRSTGMDFEQPVRI